MNLSPAWLVSVHHDGSPRYVSDLYPRLGEEVTVRLRAASTAPIRRAFLRTFPDGEQSFTPMTAGQGGNTTWWQAKLPIREPLVHYRFLLEADDGAWWFTAAGVSAAEPLDNTDFKILADYHAPAWVLDAVFYQIFPDRFANGDPANDPRPEEYEYRGSRPKTHPWGTPPAEGQQFSLIFYGGDLPGIIQRLDHITNLSANALYLNPIFTAYSNHKYDVVDYEHVDPHLGGDEALIALRRELDQRGMRYILDIVPNHCGYWHSWFQKARADASSVEAGFFTFNKHPDDYVSWLGVWTLPKLNYRSAELRRRMYGGEEAVFRRWLRDPFRADGWRVDVANMLARQGSFQRGGEITSAIRQAVKETRPDAYFMGENFFDATAQLQGDQLDGVMNYRGFTTPLLYWLRGFQAKAIGLQGTISSPVAWGTGALEGTLRNALAAIPWQVALQQFNMLGSHDTARVRTVLEGNDALHRLAAILQFTYPGVPCIYYGDEIGMTDDPALRSRGCMPWDEAVWDHDLLAFYRRLAGLRRSSAALKYGSFQLLAVEQDFIAYQREGRDEGEGRVLVTANRSQTPRPAGGLPVAHADIPDGARFEEFFTGQETAVQGGRFPLPELPQGATLWVLR